MANLWLISHRHTCLQTLTFATWTNLSAAGCISVIRLNGHYRCPAWGLTISTNDCEGLVLVRTPPAIFSRIGPAVAALDAIFYENWWLGRSVPLPPFDWNFITASSQSQPAAHNSCMRIFAQTVNGTRSWRGLNNLAIVLDMFLFLQGLGVFDWNENKPLSAFYRMPRVFCVGSNPSVISR